MAVSGNVGLSSILTIDACIHDGFVAFNDLKTDLVLEEFFLELMRLMKSTHQSRQAGAIFQNLTTTQVKEMKIPLPPIHMQLSYIKKISCINDFLLKIKASFGFKESLFNSVSQQAFSGKL